MGQNRRKPKKKIPSGAPRPVDGFYLHGHKFASVEAYREWCQYYGFNDSTHKSALVFRQELAKVKEIEKTEALSEHKNKQKNKKAEAIKNLPKELIHYGQYLKQSKLLDKRYTDALVSLTRFNKYWIRDIQDWKIKSHNADRQFYSLVDHLLSKYKMPAFMYQAWFAPSRTLGGREPPTSETQRKWFVHLAQGGSARKLDKMPVKWTKKMAHLFMRVPSKYDIHNAIRWCQIIGMDGDERLVNMAMYTRLGQSFKNEDFWITVLQFFINNPMLDRAHLGPMIDYIASQKFEGQRVWTQEGVYEWQNPPQPNFSMKGRTAEALLRQVAEWHGELSKDKKERYVQWDPREDINPLDRQEGTAEKKNMKVWAIKEITNNKILRQEGRAMRHCVASYVGSCTSGRCSIWSMTVENMGGLERCVTIEVDNRSKTIVQVRGKNNRLPTQQEKRIVGLWCTENGLKSRYGSYY